LSGNAAFDVVAAAAGGGTGALAATAAEAKNLSLYNFAMTSSAGNFTITEGAGASLKTATVTLLGVGNDPANLSTINTELAAVGITDVTAVATGTAGTYSLQGSGAAFKASATAGAAVTAATAPATGGGSLAAINQISAAVQALGTVQGSVGAGENDLNYAIGLANSQITNFSASESSIRDANVATEAANLTKAQVLEQASVAAMAQANSAPQAILSLLKS
jgi:flagellin